MIESDRAMKKFIYGSATVLLFSFGVLTGSQPTTSTALATQQNSETPSAQPLLDPEVEIQQFRDSLVKPKAIKILFNGFSSTREEGVKTVYDSGTIYYSKDELFVIYDKENKEDTNFATIEGKLYAWRTGAKAGKILKRIDNDIKMLLIYLIDVSAIKRSIYFQSYRENPDDFSVTQDGDTKTILFKKVNRPFAGIRVQQNPFWLSSFLLCDCQSITPTTPLFGAEVSRPIPLDKIPDSVKVLPPDVEFEPTQETVESY